MKGMSMAIKIIIIMIISLAVLMILISVAGTSKGSIDITIKRNVLFQCCTDRAIWNCEGATLWSAECMVPWKDENGNNKVKLSDLAKDVGIDENNLGAFCLCPG